MTPEQALGIIDRAAKIALLNDSDRNAVKEAVRVLIELLESLKK